MDYAVGTTLILTPDLEEVILRFIIFEDGTVFEFYGNYGSLRSTTLITKEAAYYAINICKKYTYHEPEIIRDANLICILYNGKNGIISKYINNDMCNIETCFILKPDLANTFIRRMLYIPMPYCNTETMELFDIYKYRELIDSVYDIDYVADCP
jgi:hypothetical protein